MEISKDVIYDLAYKGFSKAKIAKSLTTTYSDYSALLSMLQEDASYCEAFFQGRDAACDDIVSSLQKSAIQGDVEAAKLLAELLENRKLDNIINDLFGV
ncbi:MAG: hypothetical protein RR277_00970 [Rikenellaceae bacterium]